MDEQTREAQQWKETPQLQEQEGAEGWKAYIPTAGGWWVIEKGEDMLYRLYFRATVHMSTASPPESPHGEDSYEKLSDVYQRLVIEERMEE